MPSRADLPKLVIKNPFDMTKLTWLPVTPPGATVDTKLQKFFNWTLSDDFLIAGDPFITLLEGWHDQEYMKAIRITFDNGNSTSTTPIFGINSTTTLKTFTKTTAKLPANTTLTGSTSKYLKSNYAITELAGG